jgi:hypothetical protein
MNAYMLRLRNQQMTPQKRIMHEYSVMLEKVLWYPRRRYSSEILAKFLLAVLFTRSSQTNFE